MSITAQISYDRSSMMSDIMGGGKGQVGGRGQGGFDRNQFADMFGSSSSLTLEEYEKYAEAESVQDFYYTLTAYFNGSDSFSPVSDETEEESDGDTDEADENISSDKSFSSGFPGGMGGMFPGGGFSSGDFTIIGYSSDSSMTD